jgi:hypothetical protein
MAKTLQELDELLKLVRDEDLDTLRLIERELHTLVERKARDESRRRENGVEREVLSKLCANVSIDPDLLTLVGIHPENPVQDDKALIRDAIARRLSD